MKVQYQTIVLIIHTSYQVSFAQFSTMMKLLLLCVIVSSSVSDVFPVNGNKRHYPSPNRFIHPTYEFVDNGNKRHNPSPYRYPTPIFEFVDIDGNKRDRVTYKITDLFEVKLKTEKRGRERDCLTD